MHANLSATSTPSRAQKAYLSRMGVPTPCLPAPGLKTCFRPYVDPSDRNGGAPHSADAAKRDIDEGKMDGFIAVAATAREAWKNTMDPNCGEELNPEFEIAGLGPQRVMAYHVESDIPNYWAYAREFVLQNHMFEPVASWSLPSHLYMVSAWSAECSDQNEAASCRGDPARKHAENTLDTPFAWTDYLAPQSASRLVSLLFGRWDQRTRKHERRSTHLERPAAFHRCPSGPAG
jgi:hypothetical protein